MSDRHTVTLVLAALAALAPAARTQSAKVLPLGADTTEGASSCYFPFLYDASRSQVIWESRAVTIGTAVLTSVEFRRDGSRSNYPALSLAQHTARMGPTTVSPASMSTTYASNITLAMTTLSSGAFNIAALPAPNPAPAPFAIRYPLSSPFIYISSQGNLLLDWTTGSGPATQKSDYQLDGVTTATSGGTGYVRPFGAWGKFAGSDPAAWKADPTGIVPGGSVNLALGGFRQGYPSNLVVGMSDTTYNGASLPFDLGVIGATGNTLYTSIDLVVSFSLTQTSPGNWGANPSFALPNDPNSVGLTAFLQSFYADPGANPAGLVTSSALALTVGSPGPIGKMIGADGTVSATGGVLPFLPVIRLVGSIQ